MARSNLVADLGQGCRRPPGGPEQLVVSGEVSTNSRQVVVEVVLPVRCVLPWTAQECLDIHLEHLGQVEHDGQPVDRADPTLHLGEPGLGAADEPSERGLAESAALPIGRDPLPEGSAVHGAHLPISVQAPL